MQEDWIGTKVKKVLLSLVQNKELWIGYKGYQLLFIRSISEFLNLVPQMILVMAPELQEDWLGTKVKKVLLTLIQNKELGATRDVTAPELQEVSLYQFI